jgi:hypothetical protein
LRPFNGRPVRPFTGGRFSSLAFSGFGVSVTGQPAIPFPAADDRPKSPLFHVILPVLKEFSGIPGSLTGRSVAIATPPNSVSLGSLARVLPPAQDDRALFYDFAVLESLLFAATFVACAATID